MIRHRSFAVTPSLVAPVFIRRLKAERVYLLVENRTATTVYLGYDTIPAADGTDGIEIISGMKYEVRTPFAPSNSIIWFRGSSGATQQRINITEGYRNAVLR